MPQNPAELDKIFGSPSQGRRPVAPAAPGAPAGPNPAELDSIFSSAPVAQPKAAPGPAPIDPAVAQRLREESAPKGWMETAVSYAKALPGAFLERTGEVLSSPVQSVMEPAVPGSFIRESAIGMANLQN